MISEPLQNPLDHLLSGFRYRDTHHLCPRTKPNSAGQQECSALDHLLSGFRYRDTHHLCPRTKPNSAGREGVKVTAWSCLGHSPNYVICASPSLSPDNVVISKLRDSRHTIDYAGSGGSGFVAAHTEVHYMVLQSVSSVGDPTSRGCSGTTFSAV
ncbi:hypothetical protein MTR_8g011575 [Medicago truncatula]|uniref:Uncharacterized protein n=1 Tax=Medicago truncatula TaxID=3880 RepID=A0A072TMM4_MEDTR|nr:hypothetical protein MTR_8g011575 [Medicago truncatula]